MNRTLKIGVVMGGPLSEHDVSLVTGRNVVTTLRENGYDASQIYVTTRGNWLLNNQSQAYDPADVYGAHDLMFNAMHGEFGEDG
jgi:D-alanine-D-alanine ligase